MSLPVSRSITGDRWHSLVIEASPSISYFHVSLSLSKFCLKKIDLFERLS